MVTDEDIAAWAAVGAVAAALGIAWRGNRRSDRQNAQERERADTQLREERERSDRERRAERNVNLLIEAYDLYAEYNQSPQTHGDLLFKLHTRLAVLPWTVATLIRFATGAALLNDPDSKKAWVVHRAGRGREVKPTEVGFDLLEHEFPADLWFLRSDQPLSGQRQPWWLDYEQ